jgi:hypothetical protein
MALTLADADAMRDVIAYINSLRWRWLGQGAGQVSNCTRDSHPLVLDRIGRRLRHLVVATLLRLSSHFVLLGSNL